MLENPISQKANYFAVWVTLLLLANHKEKKFMWNGEVIIIKEGQLLTGRKALSKQTGVPQSTIEDILKFLESQHQIQQQKTTKFRLITVINWKEYQNTNNTSDNKATTKQQQTDTNKNDKNDKNVKNKVMFDLFWNLYDKKVSSSKCKSKWDKLTLQEQKKAMVFIPRYKQTTPDKKFRKNPETFLNNKSWNDELVGDAEELKPTHYAGDMALYGDSDIEDKLNKGVIKD